MSRKLNVLKLRKFISRSCFYTSEQSQMSVEYCHPRKQSCGFLPDFKKKNMAWAVQWICLFTANAHCATHCCLFKNVAPCGGDLHYNENITKYKQIKLRLQKTKTCCLPAFSRCLAPDHAKSPNFIRFTTCKSLAKFQRTQFLTLFCSFRYCSKASSQTNVGKGLISKRTSELRNDRV